ncbi:type I restriction-modification system subunit M [Clostridium sp. D33t1_170424_F3]|uniref:type I restriction-modification system subunit M n=1 Tax=Clostridium sp. D33t1_170424_F3 TaxID=2787099 RepID=UPI0018AC06BF|nr:type I restriction-modification system subunit M [Clostridium sp. D33t1_170424_F3]
MNKQQLANKIWESANRMRSKIEANEYKDYILGFIFYKFLSDKEVDRLKKDGYRDSDLREYVHENNADVVTYCQRELGYFIAYDNLFSTWLAKGNSFTVDNVRTALSAFNRLISDTQKKVFSKIFNTLETGLSKLGDSTSSQTKSISELIQLIKDIPTDGKQDYDVLGFIYEYLISNFAANAGKKAGEFYTPHEVSQLMSEIVAHHLRGREKIEIYDPTSGSGSLLITIGKSVSKYTKSKDDIMYYAQELKENTYNLTRMNLIMRGIKPDNIFTRCGDTLEQDWPMYDDVTQEYNPLYLDAVISNPPYSQRWDPTHKDTDSRYRYGIAPKGKADYAFLLHDLYHLKPDGIMTIVLPHGVLFRGDALGGTDGQGEGEGKIRCNLIENNNIEAIIGLPANIFFGTGIPTIILVLRQKREESDVLFIDASKGFTKVGKTNKLMASDIKRIVDAVAARPQSIEKFARLVSKEEIRRNGYNLNIPRYIDSSDAPETWDIYATMFGGIPNQEIERLEPYWTAFPRLRNLLFASDDTPYSALAVQNIKGTIEGSTDVQAFVAAHQAAFADFDAYLDGELIKKMMELNVSQTEDIITQDIFGRIAPLPLLDKYQAYQLLDDQWSKIATDLEIVQTEGFESTKQVDPNMVIKKKGDKEEEVQNGWVGHVIPFDLVQTTLLKEDYDALRAKEARLDEIAAELTEIIDSIDEGDRGDFLNEDNTAFAAKEFAAKLAEIYGDVSSPELDGLQGYLDLLEAKAGKAEKMDYIKNHQEVSWANVEGNSPYAKAKVSVYVKALRAAYTFPEVSFEGKMVQAEKLMTEEKTVKSQVKKDAEALHLKTKETIEGLSDEQVLELLRLKWISPLCASLRAMPEAIIATLEKAVQALADKYAETYLELDKQIQKSEAALAGMIDDLTGSEFDMKGLSAFQSRLKGK